MKYQLTVAFVRTYSIYNDRLAKESLPNPATFRAAALSHLKEKTGEQSMYATRVVGMPGREIAQVAEDAATRTQLTTLQNSPETEVLSRRVVKNNTIVHRSVWPFFVTEQACADCHNPLQMLSGDDQWKLGDLMGAQVIEQSIESQLISINRNALIQAILLFSTVFFGWIFGMYLIYHFRLAKELKRLATTDPLTACMNRRELYDRVSALQGKANGALLMLDLDKFKSINDTYGHDAVTE
jgi:hypothetical protein